MSYCCTTNILLKNLAPCSSTMQLYPEAGSSNATFPRLSSRIMPRRLFLALSTNSRQQPSISKVARNEKDEGRCPWRVYESTAG